MPEYVQKPTITSLQVAIKPEAKESFFDWQAELNTKITSAPGFVSLEFSSPTEQQKSWLIVQRFIDPESSGRWLRSTVYQELIDQLKSYVLDNQFEESQSAISATKGNITEVFITDVNPVKEAAYRAWTAKIHHIEAKFPGFRGVYVQSPKNKGTHWITLLQFDTLENLDRWLQSPERKQVLRESASLVSSLESHRVISPYAGWFASIAKTGTLPPAWKQSMLVLLVLFPIVVMEIKYLSPLLSSLNASLSTFIGNALSVTLISFPMMPIAIIFLGWWLSTSRRSVTIAGSVLIAALYAIEIILFWYFL